MSRAIVRQETYTPEGALRRCNKVFVYGTLKKGYGNHSLLREAKFIGEALTLKRFRLFDVGFPYAVPSQRGARLKGEVYEVNSPEIMKALDWLEGYPSHYKRQVIMVELENGQKIEAWIYVVDTPEGREIEPINGIVAWGENYPYKEEVSDEFGE